MLLYMNREKAHDILNISENEYINDAILKKKYHRACLKYHPDKKKDNSYTFVDLTNAYNFVGKNIKDYEIHVYSYKDYLFLLDEDKIQNCIKFINKMNKTILYPLKKHLSDVKKYTITTDLKNVMNNEVFIIKEYNIYVPLWHNEVIFYDRKLKVNIEINIPNYMSIDNDNNIYIYITVNNKTLGDIIYLDITPNKKINFKYDDTFINTKKKVFKKQGIPKINNKNIYDFSLLADIIVYLDGFI